METIAKIELTSRQNEVAVLLVDGLLNKQISSKLFLAEQTVKFHIATMFEKFDVHTRVQLAVALIRGGYVA